MRGISADTRKRINQLYEPVSLWKRLSRSRDDTKILSEIGNSGEPAATIDILPFVLANRKEVAIAAGAAVHKLIAATSPTDLASLDRLSRERSPYGLEWHKLSPKDLDRFQGLGDTSASLLGMASFHHSGYVREEAVKRLDLISTGVEISFLLIRLNDWVSDVRDAAHRAINSRVNPAYCRSLIGNLALVSRLEQTERVDSQPIIEAIKGVLQSADCRSLLLEAFGSSDRFIRRVSFRLATHSKDRDTSRVLRQALGDTDTVIRLWAARSVSSAFEGAALDQMLSLMKRDRFMPVRREALRICVSRRLEQAGSEVRSALLDAHPSMRSEARYHFQQIDPLDIAEFYRQALSAGDGINLYSAIGGLGETGCPEDGDLLMPYTSHSASKIRRAAIRALGKLNSGGRLEVLIQGLMDEVPSVSREGLKSLTAQATLIGKERVWEIFSSTSYLHVRRNALSLIERLGKWDSIYFMVKATAAFDEDVANRARVGIDRWFWRFNRTFPTPTTEQLVRLRSALEECGKGLDEKTREEVWFCVRGF